VIRDAGRRVSGRRSAGFTLLEILVVMSLLSVVMLALGAALRTVARSEASIDRRLNRADEFRVAVSFLKGALGYVSARKMVVPAQVGGSPFLFAAGPEDVSWVGVMPARYGAGGRTFFRLAVEQTSLNGVSDSALAIRFAPLPLSGQPNFPDWSQAEVRVLVSGVSSFSIQYEDARTSPSVWSPDWSNIERLPERLVLSVQTTTGPWPQFVIPLRPLPWGSGSGGGFVIGGST
jgi:general secretion pathway protein J